jgi:hypothetical protein
MRIKGFWEYKDFIVGIFECEEIWIVSNLGKVIKVFFQNISKNK